MRESVRPYLAACALAIKGEGLLNVARITLRPAK